MSRPWHKGTPATHLEPVIIGQFNTFNDWVSFAPDALSNLTDANGKEVKAICIDDLGRRCNIGADFMRARDEDKFPVRYFIEMQDRALVDILLPEIEVVAHRYVYSEPLSIRGEVQNVPKRGIVHGYEPSHHNGYPVSDVEGLYSKTDVDGVIARMQTDIDTLQGGFKHLSALAVESKRIADAKLEAANNRIAELEKRLSGDEG